MIINIIIWVGGFLCSVLYNKAKNEIVKVLFKRSFPLLIKYTKEFHEQNDKLFYKIGGVLYDWAEWVIVSD